MSRTRRLLIGAALALALLAYFFHGVDWSALRDALLGARVAPLAGVVVLILAAYAVRAWRWADLLSPLGRVPRAELFSATMIGFAAGLLLPRAGEVLRPWLVSRSHPITFTAGFATIVVERLLDVFAVLALLAVYLFALPRPAAQVEGPLMVALTAAGAAAAAASVAVLGLLFALHANAERATAVLQGWLARAPRWLGDRLTRGLHGFVGGLAVLRAPLPHLAKIGAQSLVLWVLVAVAYYLNNVAFSIDLPWHTTLLLNAFVVVGEAIPTPAMVGGFHAAYLIALNEVLGVERTTAAAAGIAAHVLMNLPVLVIGLALAGRRGLGLVGAADQSARERVRNP